MTLDQVRLTLRLGRFELLAFVVLVLGSVVAAFVASAWVDSLRPAAECIPTTFGVYTEPPQSCKAAVAALNAWYSAQGGLPGLIGGLVVFLPLAAGLFLGVPIVARELERGTTRLAWTLTPSRLRWYVARLVPVLVIVAVISFAAGIASDRVMAANEPGIDLANSFAGFGSRGVLLASRAVFIFAVAVAVASIVGRSLPSIIIATVIVAVGLTGGGDVHQRILRTEAVPRESGQVLPGDMYIDQRFRLPDGSLVRWDHFGNDGNGQFDQDGNPMYPIVDLVVPGERYRGAETREALVLAGGSLVALTLAAFVVTRRRPD